MVTKLQNLLRSTDDPTLPEQPKPVRPLPTVDETRPDPKPVRPLPTVKTRPDPKLKLPTVVDPDPKPVKPIQRKHVPTKVDPDPTKVKPTVNYGPATHKGTTHGTTHPDAAEAERRH